MPDRPAAPETSSRCIPSFLLVTRGTDVAQITRRRWYRGQPRITGSEFSVGQRKEWVNEATLVVDRGFSARGLGSRLGSHRGCPGCPASERAGGKEGAGVAALRARAGGGVAIRSGAGDHGPGRPQPARGP